MGSQNTNADPGWYLKPVDGLPSAGVIGTLED